jgi:UDP-glucose 4-epimerase
MQILLTGSSGWLGRFLAPKLREAGIRVVGLDLVPAINTDVVGSLADQRFVERVFGDFQIDGVIHGGALHKPDIARYPAQAFVDVNITGTQKLLELASANGCDRFVFTSTTSLMISETIHAGKAGGARRAAWLDESLGPLEPRNIYGVTKRAAEQVCALHHREKHLPILVLLAGRFFPEDDDMHRHLSGPNIKANEFLGRRLTAEDAAEAHLVAIVKAPDIGFGTYIIAAPTPFSRNDAGQLIEDAPGVIGHYFPYAAELYERVGWHLPQSIERIYDPSLAQDQLGFCCRTDFGTILSALRKRLPLPFAHDPTYVSPKEERGQTISRLN